MGGKYRILRIPTSKALQRWNGMEQLQMAGKQPPADDLASGLSLLANAACTSGGEEAEP